MKKTNDKKICCMCERTVAFLTFHHLIPKTLHGKKWYNKTFSKEKLNSGIEICEDCHEALHDFICEKDLGKNYNTLELLMSHSKIQKFIKWVSKQKSTRNGTCRAKNR